MESRTHDNDALLIRRDRTGCWNCKARKRKCSEERPSCSDCIRRGWQCRYGLRLRWEADSLSAGRSFGRSFSSSKRLEPSRDPASITSVSPADAGLPWVNTTLSDYACESSESPASGPSPLTSMLPVPYMLVVPDQSLEQCHSALQQYYYHVWSSSRVLQQGPGNPFQQIIIPLSLRYSALRDAMMALAAHDLLSRGAELDSYQRGRYHITLLQCKQRSLGYAQQLLSRQVSASNQGAVSLNQGELDCLLLITALHVLLENAAGSSSQWVAHLLGGLFLVRQYGETLFSPEVYRFVTDYLSLSEVFLSSTGFRLNVEPLDGWLVAQRQALFPSLRTKHGRSRINPWTGICSELVTIIGNINATLRLQACSDTTFLSQCGPDLSHFDLHYLEGRLAKLDQWSDDSDTGTVLHLIAGTFELAAWIYLRLAQTSFGRPWPEDSLVSSALDRLEAVHEQQGPLLGVLPYPMWALFIVASAAAKHERQRIYNLFEELKLACCSDNISRIWDATVYIWTKRDVESPDEAAQTKNDFSVLNWHDMVQRLRLQIAFMV